MAELTRDAVVDLYAAYARRDFDRVARYIDDDVDWLIYGPTHVFPFVGARKGKRSVLEALAQIAEMYTVARYEPEIVIVEGDRSAAMIDAGFEQRKTGRLLRFKITHFLRFSGERVVEFRELFNSFDAAEQALGHELIL